MLRFLVGYILGTVLGFLSFAAVVNYSEDPIALIFFAVVWSIIFVIGLIWCHKHHIKKRNDYYKKIRGPSKRLV